MTLFLVEWSIWNEASGELIKTMKHNIQMQISADTADDAIATAMAAAEAFLEHYAPGSSQKLVKEQFRAWKPKAGI